jgi:hypothetical protein
MVWAVAWQLLLNWKKDLSIPFNGYNKLAQGDPLADEPIIEANASILA